LLSPNFIGGFAKFYGEGRWRNPQTGHIACDPTKILLIAAERQPDLPHRLSAASDAYKTKFHQHSVGLIPRDSSAIF
jgi:Protein of unknown function (DUF3574)